MVEVISKFLDNLWFEINDTIVTANLCIWCGKETKLTKSHLFPECLGIKFYSYTTCRQCNSFIGEEIEGTVMDNPFFTAALAKIGLKNRKEAYRMGKKIDTESGFEVIINDQGKVQPVPKMLTKDRYLGTPEKLKEKAVKSFKRKNPNVDVGPIEKFYDDHVKKEFVYEGIVFSKEITPEGVTEIQIGWKKRDPDPRLIFKIIHEFLTISGLNRDIAIRQNMKGLYKTYDLRKKTVIRFSSELDERCISNTTHAFRNYKYIESIPFGNYHYAMLRLSKKYVLYVEVVFFGIIKTFFTIGNITQLNQHTISMLDRGLIFELGSTIPFEKIYPNFERAHESKLCDVVVELRHWEIQQRNERIAI